MLVASPGATTKDLMQRMGRDNERAALIYQHATNKADQAIAHGLDELLKAQRDADDPTRATTTCGGRPGARGLIAVNCWTGLIDP